MEPSTKVLRDHLILLAGTQKGGMRHGFGRQEWPDGAYYEGNWENDKTNGNGKFCHANGDIYEGYWVDDRAFGYGVYKHCKIGVSLMISERVIL